MLLRSLRLRFRGHIRPVGLGGTSLCNFREGVREMSTQKMLVVVGLMLVLLTAKVTALLTPNLEISLPFAARNTHSFRSYRPRTVAAGLKSSLSCTKEQDDATEEKSMDGCRANNINTTAWDFRQFPSLVASIAGTAGIFSYCTEKAFAAADINLSDKELVSSLPPPWIPLLFAVVVVGGTALLTGSLGDVIADEASLGNLSGARAKKESERSRSSFFKKK